ncbi:hypothetical protein HanRHA438_Chr07g0318981 [Helianthus annuus]|uniref:Putative knottin, scorpion toxin-like protein n=1 Tax=Helianthus annuus TaxID=4232 RepID=A0A251UDC3_HELAN|nr:hypothetical protein HanXRQr2_Chr07g0309891 [Helianthus annuus]KAJ0551296.1 hypothetical protein HanHA300_Chr07g0255541 [Helianthus annuus]KAJ0564261.1 hypothetical protein HanHA89_Chr07g0272321 [Helianthus annuus]KAJ0732327.1 hypothetical protein HanOQP8_Chr07g0261961 [Helianthus annuus]KAJ0909203.1 hypothetical protein HanRHA438_Chr07g0318981 [Helianthus annuus]
MKFSSVAFFVFCNLLIIMAATLTGAEDEKSAMCYFLHWEGPCPEENCENDCIRVGYSDGICRSHMLRQQSGDPDACYCIGPCQN